MDLAISALHDAYERGQYKPSEVVDYVLSRLEGRDQDNVWISTVDPGAARERGAWLDSQLSLRQSLPLFGLPFSVKDNIDVEDEMTTAACPGFAYRAERSATVVELAVQAGAIYVGKTNLDQFATGLIGVRSPYGIPVNPFNAAYIPGGSSSGAGVSVSTGIVSFGFGTDTGGSGRVPASYNGIAGLKPAPGWLSRRGLVFACRSIDTPSVFAKSATDACHVFNTICEHDKKDPFSISEPMLKGSQTDNASLHFGQPDTEQLKFFGNTEVAGLYNQALAHLSLMHSSPATVDFSLLTDINDLMFFGPLLSERDVSVGKFVDTHAKACDPIVQSLITGSRRFTAADAYSAMYRIADARVEMESIWQTVDVLMLPTVGSIYTLKDIVDEPLKHNFNNGYYTNFANPLGLSAIATPFAITQDGVPWGVTFVFKPGAEKTVSDFADRFSAGWQAR